MAILFDLDGTLVDTAIDIINAINQLCVELHQPIANPKTLRNNTSFGLTKLLEIALRLNPTEITPEQLNKLKLRFKELYTQTKFINTRLFPGILELLVNLKKYKFNLGIVTNKHSEFTTPILNQVKIIQYFNCIITADLVSTPKPDPAGVLLALEKLNEAPQNCIFIGDAAQDIIAGNAAKVTTIAALFGYIGDDVLTSHWDAAYFVNTAEELWPLIKQIYPRQFNYA